MPSLNKPKGNGMRSKGRTANELALDLDKVLDRLLDDEDQIMSPDRAGSIASIANVELRSQLGKLEHAKARGEKPSIAFFTE